MRRRHLLAGSAALAAAHATLARPALGNQAKTLIHVPQANLTSLDPVWTTAVVTRNSAHLLFETLYGRDENLNPKPQMVEGHLVEDGGKRWTMRLREGLLFHDGERVLARDCVASLRRWMVRDPIGQTIAARLDALEAPDDRTIVFRLNKPFASLPYALAKTQPSPVIMPERLATTDPYKQVQEIVGSGPFQWVANEYVPGSRAVYAKFERYSPRDEPASYAAGGYRVLVDRVEWNIIPDAATAASALINGEVDWVDQPLPDLLPRLRRARGVTVGQIDLFGTFGALRPNQLHGPTANPGIRRAMMAAIDQVEVMTAVMGEDRSLWRAPVGYFLPGTPSANDAGMENLRRRSTDEIKAMLAEAGYNGERVVFMHPTDQTFYDAMASVATAAFRKVGINVDDQSMDWGTVVQRRTSMEPLEKGGWSIFPAGYPAAEYRDPVFASNLRGNGRRAWFGWPEDPEMEAMRDRWMESTDEAELQRLNRQVQARAFETVPFIPLGQYLPSAAWRSNLDGILKGPVPVFWNVTKG
ncbi:ABC transporter substrate-binding protein [Siccirubricoccus sp. G192]|uniref:ABC transporter substrate-binding protein n=1 Tax=Siccirubricoccus sp. G192 TaxID=2849651 RepID=UPI001C2CBC9A|nr:ABC transporter substrate-binding protein [Siccirubricoccus sp. G192]MBV1798097.1 ABC transporter substrate-binding protein [Siccirubricoccus sp. G192]